MIKSVEIKVSLAPQMSSHSVLDAEPDGRIRWFQKKYPLRTEREQYRRTSGIHYEGCIYYYWYEYLKLSTKYKTACENNGKGMRRIYQNFGNVFEMNFWEWWETKDDYGHDRGARLFGDSVLNKMESFISLDEAESYRKLVETGKYKLLAVPIEATKDEIQRSFSLLLKGLKVETEKRKSNALYQIFNAQVTAKALRKSLDAWRYLHVDGHSKQVIGAILSDRGSEKLVGELKKPLGQRSENHRSRFAGGDSTYFNLVAYRALLKAKANIKAVELGIFPVRRMDELVDL